VTLVFAHLGHWYFEVPIWLGPFLLLIGWSKLSDRRKKKKNK
jgi:hypothetical protein